MNYDDAGTLASGQAVAMRSKATMRFGRFLREKAFDLATAEDLEAALRAELETLRANHNKISPTKLLQVERIEDMLGAQIESFRSPGPDEIALVKRLKRCYTLCGKLLSSEFRPDGAPTTL
jgi:hypothetical protein